MMKYHNLNEMQTLAEKHGLMLWQVALNHEIENTGLSQKQILLKTEERYEIMVESATAALQTPQEMPGNLISGVSAMAYSHAQDKNSVAGAFINKVMAYAMSCSEVNASMGKICAAPTAGSCGIVPGVLYAFEKDKGIDRETILNALITASAIGAVIMQNATVSGAEGGCQAECGAAAAMAAAAAVQIMGGTPEMCMDACSITLMNVLGLVCDPVAGLVQIPCAQRNASQAISALLSTDLVLGGMKSPISADEMIDSLYRVGKQLPMELKETSLGGMATTPSAIKIKEEIFG